MDFVYIHLYEIIEIITEISEDEIILLEQLIKNHNNVYQNIFNEPLNPKYHIIMHYPTCISIMGPLKFLSCNKWEAFHQKSKAYGRIINCRINVPHSLAKKLQLNLAYRFFTRKGFQNIVEITSCTNSDEKLSSLKINGTTYKENHMLHLCNNYYNDPTFGIICDMVRVSAKQFVFIIKKCKTLGLNNHIKPYQLVLPNNNNTETIFIKLNMFYKPIKIHVTSEGKHVISCRDII